eukprot:4098034-Alexandrium_andersonii.AAC.1
MVRRPSGGGPERAPKGLCGGGWPPLGRLGHSRAARLTIYTEFVRPRRHPRMVIGTVRGTVAGTLTGTLIASS